MSLIRKIEETIYNHLSNEDNFKSMIVNGARQVGKTYSILKVLDDYFPNRYLYINFILNNNIVSIFDEDLDPKRIIMQLRLRFDISVSTEEISKYIFFFDEIQNCPRAIESLKFFTINKIRVIASGSLLGLSLKSLSSYPTGYVKNITMHSLDFEEFLWSKGISTEKIDYLKQLFISRSFVPTHLHNEFNTLFREYVVLGGMPEVVVNYLKFGLVEAKKVKLEILRNYENDILKYSEYYDKHKALDIFNSLYLQLSKANQKFKYSLINKYYNSEKLSSSLFFLLISDMLIKHHKVKSLIRPLSVSKDERYFKLLLHDHGLFIEQIGNQIDQMLLSDESFIYKGFIYESVYTSIFAKLDIPLYYYSPNDTLEIEFIYESDKGVFPIDVKSGSNLKSKSLKETLKKNNLKVGLKFSLSNIIVNQTDDYTIINYPCYLSIFLKDFSI